MTTQMVEDALGSHLASTGNPIVDAEVRQPSKSVFTSYKAISDANMMVMPAPDVVAKLLAWVQASPHKLFCSKNSNYVDAKCGCGRDELLRQAEQLSQEK